MLQIEELTVKVKAVEDLVAAEISKPLVAARQKIRTWLMSKAEPKHEVAGLVKALLEVRLARQESAIVTDADAVYAEFVELVRRGRFTQEELLTLITGGAIQMADPEAVAGALATKLPGYRKPTRTETTTVEAGDPAHSPLKINVLPRGRFAGLKEQIRSRLDLEGVVSRVLEAPLPEPEIPRGQVALSRTGRRR